MNRNEELFRQLGELGIVPVIKLDRPEDAVPLARALCDGGLPCAEVTFRTAAAEQAIRAITQAFPEMLVGAGTVLTPEQVDVARDAGAKFIVSPGLNPRVVEHCQSRSLPVVPGISTASELEQALSLGLNIVKFFPAEQVGGLGAIKALSAPYGNVRFMPTGGVNELNIQSYLDFSKVLACGGSWMVPPALIAQGRFDEIEKRTRQAVNLMLDFRIRSISLPGAKAPVSQAFAGLMASAGEGEGTVVVETRSLERAAAYLRRNGLAPVEQDGSLLLRAGGFSIRICAGA